MPQGKALARFLLLDDLKLHRWEKPGGKTNIIRCYKESDYEICPKCTTSSRSVYDHRLVQIKDAPIRNSIIILKIRKRRFYCYTCRKPFTEPVSGIYPKQRTTQRFKRSIVWACDNFNDLKRVRRAYRCSNAFIYKVLYEQLQLKLQSKLNYPWPVAIGIDEHFFSRARGYREFATVFTDLKNRRVRELVLGKARGILKENIKHIEGRNNVKYVAMDMSDTYKGFVFEHFPNAQIVADKFHVLRLLTNAINRRRKEITGDKRSNPIRKLLLRNRHKLKYHEKKALDLWLKDHTELNEIYFWKERLHLLYRTKGYERAKGVFTMFMDQMKLSILPEIIKLRKTLLRWSDEILNYFKVPITNAMTEGFNRVASLVKNRAFGYKSFRNYRLRFLNACAH